MKILSVDTSATAASVALSEEGKLIGETFINTSLTHSQTLIPMVEQLLNNTKTEISDIDAIAVNAGPGSFTGVRIGVAAVKGLAFANNIPCVSVSTLESMAYNFLSTDCIVCAVMDARCSQVYNALFEIKNGVVTRLCDDRALSLDDLKNELLSVDGRIIIAGDGTDNSGSTPSPIFPLSMWSWEISSGPNIRSMRFSNIWLMRTSLAS